MHNLVVIQKTVSAGSIPVRGRLGPKICGQPASRPADKPRAIGTALGKTIRTLERRMLLPDPSRRSAGSIFFLCFFIFFSSLVYSLVCPWPFIALLIGREKACLIGASAERVSWGGQGASGDEILERGRRWKKWRAFIAPPSELLPRFAG
jgi:hypothetical protein